MLTLNMRWMLLVISALLGSIHLFGSNLKWISAIPRSRWLSAAGGIAVSYVCIHILPELSKAQAAFTSATSGWLQEFERHVYVMTLVGMITFYGLERAAKRSRNASIHSGMGDKTSAAVFWLHMGSYFFYNVLIGYLLVNREEQDVRGLVFFAVAIGLHFLSNDFGLREDHKDTYDRVGRWLLFAAAPLGCLVGLLLPLSKAALALPFAFLAGGIILNVLKEELPEERQSRFGAFLGGAIIYALLLLFAR